MEIVEASNAVVIRETISTFTTEQLIDDPLELMFFEELSTEEQYYYIVDYFKEDEELKALADKLVQLAMEEEDWKVDALEYKESDEGKDLCELMNDSY